MIKEGVLDNPKVQKMFAQHVFPDLEVGKVGFKPGKYMASTDEIYIKIIGIGGHAALPAKTRNPILPASNLIELRHLWKAILDGCRSQSWRLLLRSSRRLGKILERSIL